MRLTRRQGLVAAASLALAGSARAAARSGGVLALEWHLAEDAILLGEPPAGVADLAGYPEWVGIDEPALADAVDLGTRQQPNLESIARLAPRLILASALRHRALLPRLEGIAPTLLVDDGPRDADLFAAMVGTLRQIADRLGRVAAADAALATLDADLAAQRAVLAAKGLAGAPVVVAQGLPGIPRLRVFTANSAPGGVLGRLGLAPGWAGGPEPFGFATAEAEALAGLDRAHVLLLGTEVPAALSASPLWRRMPFVVGKRLHVLGPAIWPFGGPASMARLAQRSTAALSG